MNTPKSTSINPLSNFVLGHQETSEEKTRSGLFLPKTTEKRLSFIDVIAIGPLVEGVKVGDRVVFKEYAQFDFKLDGEDYVVVDASDVLANVKGE